MIIVVVFTLMYLTNIDFSLISLRVREYRLIFALVDANGFDAL